MDTPRIRTGPTTAALPPENAFILQLSAELGMPRIPCAIEMNPPNQPTPAVDKSILLTSHEMGKFIKTTPLLENMPQRCANGRGNSDGINSAIHKTGISLNNGRRGKERKRCHGSQQGRIHIKKPLTSYYHGTPETDSGGGCTRLQGPWQSVKTTLNFTPQHPINLILLNPAKHRTPIHPATEQHLQVITDGFKLRPDIRPSAAPASPPTRLFGSSTLNLSTFDPTLIPKRASIRPTGRMLAKNPDPASNATRVSARNETIHSREVSNQAVRDHR